MPAEGTPLTLPSRVAFGGPFWVVVYTDED
jgi:hypothetical protein